METHELHTAQLELQAGKPVTLTLKHLTDEEKPAVLITELGKVIPDDVEISVERNDSESLAVVWKNDSKCVIKHESLREGHRFDIQWESLKHKPENDTFIDAVLLQEGQNHWYGSAQVREQRWPIESWQRPSTAYVTGDSFQNQYGGVQERYWLSSSGVALYVEPNVPLFVAMNAKVSNKPDGRITFTSKWAKPYKNVKKECPGLKYSIFQSNDVRKVHELVTLQVFDRPVNIPDEELFRHPIWSTWAKYKKNINQQIVLDYANEITENGFNAAQLEIDDDWTPRYGDHIFDTSKFPDPKAMVDTLKEKGFRVTMWVHPFASPLSKACYEGDYWMRSGYFPGIGIWWNGVGKVLDVTNPEAVTWFKNKLTGLMKKYGLTSYKFDAGEINWFPPSYNTKQTLVNPSEYTSLYAQMCYEMDVEIRAQEVRVGWRTQNLPIFVRMMDKDSHWTDNGLKTLIPSALTFSVLGYPFMLPDMIGGNAYPQHAFPQRELFIRWVQANVFLPSLQFSVAPWQYDPEVVKICQKMCKLHEDHADLMIQLARESTITGAPIIRPLWWVAPEDEIAQVIDSQFLVGDDLLVAPVLEKGAVCRDVYLPPGQWRDELRHRVYEGGQLIKDFDAKLDELPYFTRVK